MSVDKGELLQLSRRGFVAFAQMVPAVLWRGVTRGALGFFSFGLSGLALAGGYAIYTKSHDTQLPAWFVIVSVALVPLTLGVAGAFASGLRGMLGETAQQLIDRNLVPYLYALVRPIVLRTARQLEKSTGKVSQSELARSLGDSARERLATVSDGSRPEGLVSRLERYVANRLQLTLVLACLAPADHADRAAAIESLESTGIESLEETLADSIQGLATVQTVIAFAIAVAVSSIPYVVLAILK